LRAWYLLIWALTPTGFISCHICSSSMYPLGERLLH
jgi:hypothetical protein